MKTSLTLFFVLLCTTHSIYAESVKLEYTIGNLQYQSILFKAGTDSHCDQCMVLIAPDWTGIGQHYFDEAERLSQSGYTTLVVDFYGKGIKPADDAEANQLSSALINDRGSLRHRMAAAVEALKAETGKSTIHLAGIGYSFGAFAMQELERSGIVLKASIVNWGVLLDSTETTDTAVSPLLLMHGAQDQIFPLSGVFQSVEKMTYAGRLVNMAIYPEARHAFTNPYVGDNPESPIGYNETAAKAARQQMDHFLNRYFK